MKHPIIICAAVLLLSACKEDIATQDTPAPTALTEEAAGYYCQMTILHHTGPKAQMYLDGNPAPVWFSQVRDGVAYLKSPEQSADISIIYVNDMGEAPDWDHPGQDNWIDAASAHFVVNSDATGGMGAPELVPFSNLTKAQVFARERGGEIMALSEIPAELVLSPIKIDTPDPEPHQ